MDILQTPEAIEYAWLTLLIYWFVSSWRVKRTAETEPLGARSLHIATMVVAYLLLFDRNLKLGPLNLRFIAPTPAVIVIGALLTWAGIAFAIWARIHIGKYWSARVTL